MEEIHPKIKFLKDKIELERQIRDKAIELRQRLTDRNAQEQCDTDIKDADKTIEYFTEELERMQTRESRSSTVSSASSPLQTPLLSERTDAIDTSIPLTTLPSSSPVQATLPLLPLTAVDTTQKNYTTLDLLRVETPLNRAKISLKLHELEYKVDVEKKVQWGINNLAKTINHESDPKWKEVEEQRLESEGKMSVLTAAVRKYKNRYLGEEDEEDVGSPADTVGGTEAKGTVGGWKETPVVRGQPGARRSVTGTLHLRIVQAHELAHVPTRRMHNPQTVVVVKTSSEVKHRTPLSKSSRWDDAVAIEVNKASEVELLICDQAGDCSMPIGMVWFKMSDITEHQRKQKQFQEQSDPNWVPGNVAQQQEGNPGVYHAHQREESGPEDTSTSVVDDGIRGWFDVEPKGRIYLDINFVRESANRRNMDKLERARVVRERKVDIHEINGHQFVARKFYHIMKCALCDEFMVNSAYQCKGCGLTCEAKCYESVVTRCLARPQIKPSSDTEELRHNIPHRFRPLTNVSANWCCHCGFILPIGFRGARRCTECKKVCHTKCAEYIPNFCGMSMKEANEMQREMRKANYRKTLTLGRGLAELSLDSQRHSYGNISQLGDDASPSPQASLSTPTRSSLPNSRPHSMVQDIPSHQSMNSFSNPPTGTSSHRYSLFVKSPPATASRRVKVGLDDFNLLAVLGQGNFGKVMLAEEKYTNELYAIKVLKKRFVLDNDEVASTRSEKRVFMAVNRKRHPFLVSLHSSFQTVTRIYFVMEYVNGGDLMMHIQREQFSERRAKFYASEVLLALEYLHEHGIVYRDLKLDNIMLCDDGHIKLADYGLCKENMHGNNTTNTFCGTPEFMAPEILLEQPYGHAVDWWAFGVLLYEMLLGQSPFKGEDEDEIFDAVLEDEILYPIDMSRQSVSICQELLNRDPRERLGTRSRVRDHGFFVGIKWDDVLAKKVMPPFLPTINGRADTSNFDEEFTREIPILTPVNAELKDDEQREFRNFSYVSNWAPAHGSIRGHY